MSASTTQRTKTTRVQRLTFRRGSRTYHTSSLFFPPQVRRDVFALYGFVRVADDFVDATPQDAAGFLDFRTRYRAAITDGPDGGPQDPIISPFVDLARRKGFPPDWGEAFLHSMELDLTRHIYATDEETLGYIYGSAEVIGLFMARILDLPEASYLHARMLGRAMQYINFIRDLDADRRLGRSYLPWNGPADRFAQADYARAHAREFRDYLEHHIARYLQWQRQAEEGFRFIPGRYLVPIKTASDMYRWTAGKLRRNPFLVFERTVKPRRMRIVLQVLGNAARHARQR